MRSLTIALVLAFALVGCQGATDEGDGPSADVAGGDTQLAPAGAPTVTITSPEEGLIVQSGDTLTLTATVFDDRDDSEALTLVVSSSLQGDVTYPEAKASGVVTADVVLTVGGEHVVTLLATDSDGNKSSDSVSVTVNGLPGAPAVEVTPDTPTTEDDLVVEVVAEATDPNRESGELSYRYRWLRDGESVEDQTGPVVPATVTQKGQAWQVYVAAFDGFDYGEEGGALAVIANSAPACVKSSLLPSTGTADTAFTCSCIEREDADDEDPIQDTCVFYDEDVLVAELEAGEGGCVLDPSEVERGMNLLCHYIPGDGEATGEAAISPTVPVMNALPTVPTVELTPEAGGVLDLFTCAVTEESTDPDGDELVYETTWVVNDHANPGTGSSSVTPAVLVSDEVGTPTAAGDEIRCEVRASDGMGLSGAAKSNEVVLSNTAPSGGSVLLGPPGAAEGDVLTCTPSDATDPDGDTIDWVYTWTVNDEVVEGETGPEFTSEHFDKGDVVGCEAAPTDGTDEGAPVASKTSIVVQNTLPGLLQVTVTPLTVTKLETLACAYEGWSDPDPADAEATVAWSWWRALEDGTEEQLVGADSAALSASVLTAGDQVRCRVTPMNGEDAGEPKDSELALVVNTKPVVGSVKLTPEEAYADSVLTCTPFDESDADGDEVNFSYAWKVNGTEVPGETESTLEDAFNKGKEVRCVVTPFDGVAEGAAVISNPVTIGNKLPIILGVTLSPSYGAVCDEYICSVDQVVDPDEEDNVLVSYRWELNGAPVAGQGAAYSNPVLEPGDELQCFVQASDGTLGPAPEFEPVPGPEVPSNPAEIYNNPPTLENVYIQEQAPVVGEVLHCIAAGFSDTECDPAPSYVWKWYSGVSVIEGAATDTLDTSGYLAGTSIACQAIPYDGVGYGAPVLSESATLAAALPTELTVEILSPQGADGELQCALQGDPAIPDDAVWTWTWSVNGGAAFVGEETLAAEEVSHCDLVTCALEISAQGSSANSNTAQDSMPFGLDCEDQEVCTTDTCAIGGGCSHDANNAPCDDGDACTEFDSCEAGACASGAPVVCDNDVFCDGQESCDALVGCESGTPPELEADDGVDCTHAVCDEALAMVVHEPDSTLCDDDLFCTGVEHCDAEVGCQVTPLDLSDGVDCTLDSCDEESDQVVHAVSDEACDDGLFCTGVEHCEADIGCEVTPLELSDGVDCTVDSCDEEANEVVHTVSDEACDDGLFCTGVEHCDAEIGCEVTPLDLDDGIACTVDSCDEEADEVVHMVDDAACDDGLYCTGVEHCDVSSGCLVTPIEVSDGVGCTVDSCDEEADQITHVPDDGACASGELCATDKCDPDAGCLTTVTPDCCGNALTEPLETFDISCSGGTTRVEGNSAYLFCPSSNLTWQQRREACVSQGGDDLVSMETQDEESFIESVVVESFGENFQYWAIGATDSESEGSWSWVSGAQLATPFDCSCGAAVCVFPSPSGDEDCAYLISSPAADCVEWNDAACSLAGQVSGAYVCEMKLNEGVTDEQCDDPDGLYEPFGECDDDCQGVSICEGGVVVADGEDDYLLCPGPATRDEAADDCAAYGAPLARLDSADANSFVLQALKDNGIAGEGTGQHGAWFGINDIKDEGQFVWENGDAPSWPMPWADDNPNNENGDRDCAVLLVESTAGDGAWFSKACGDDPFADINLFPYVCGEPSVCGDGSVGVGEACDDGNLASGDGCSSLCANECQSLRFDGDGDYVSATDVAITYGEAFTVELWTRLEGTPNEWNFLFNHGPGAVIRIQANSSGGMRFNLDSTSIDIGGNPLPVGYWRHVALVYDNGSARAYIGGDEVANWNASSPGAAAINDPVDIGNGSHGPGVYGYDGMIRHVRISSTARYAQPFEPAEQLLEDADTVSFWPLDDGEGTTAAAYGASAADAAVVDAVWLDSAPSCDDDPYGCESAVYDGRIFEFCSVPTERGLAATHCENLGMSLASLHSAAENAWVLEHATSVMGWQHPGPYIGLSDPQLDGSYEWDSDVSVNYTNWCDNHPIEPGTRECVHMEVISEDGCLAATGPSGGSGSCAHTLEFICADVYEEAYDKSCKAIQDADDSTGDGTYWIDPDGEGGNAAFEVYCDMTTDDGGWTLVARGLKSEVGSAVALDAPYEQWNPWNKDEALNPDSTGQLDAHWHLSATTINVLAGGGAGAFRADCPEVPGSTRYWSDVSEYLWSAPSAADACKTSYEQTDSSFDASWLCTGCWGLVCEGNMVTSHYMYPGIASPWYCGASHSVDFELWVR